MEYLQLQLRIVFGATLRNRLTGTLCGAAGASESCLGDRVSWHQLIRRPFQHILMYFDPQTIISILNTINSGKARIWARMLMTFAKKNIEKNIQHKHYKCHRNGGFYRTVSSSAAFRSHGEPEEATKVG